MKKMKKFMSFMLCLVMCGSLCTAFIGCDEGDEKEPDTNTENPGGENPDKPEGEVAHVAVTLPSWVTEFQANSGEQGETEKEKEFFVTKKSYKVGDDNPFIFKPSVECYAEGWGEEVATPADADFSYQVEVKGEDGAWTVDETMIDASTTVTKDGKFDFSENAIGKTLRLTVTPDINGVTDAESVSFEFEVVDGYNAYNDYELSYISNYAENHNLSGVGSGDDQVDNQFEWKKYRTDKGLTANPQEIKGIILHKDIELTKDSFPEIFFYSEAEANGDSRLVGTLKDQRSSGLYYREILNNESFSFYGNYFRLDASKVPQIIKDYKGNKPTYDANGTISDNTVITHMQLMRIRAKEGNGIDKNKTSALITDVYLRGNSPKNEGLISQGGLIGIKTERTDCVVDNVISTECFTTVFGQKVNSKVTVNNMKCFDTFNSPIYNWGCEDMTLNNILIRNTGGPAIIADAYAEGSSVASPCIVATNFDFENELSGDESWFSSTGAKAYVNTIQDLGILLSQENRSFIKMDANNKPKMNIICIVKDDDDDVRAIEKKYHPYININGNIMDFGTGAAAYNKTGNDAVHTGVLANLLKSDDVIQKKAPVLETSGGGLAVCVGTSFVYPKDTESDGMSEGDCINLYYYSGPGFGLLGVMFELYE